MNYIILNQNESILFNNNDQVKMAKFQRKSTVVVTTNQSQANKQANKAIAIHSIVIQITKVIIMIQIIIYINKVHLNVLDKVEVVDMVLHVVVMDMGVDVDAVEAFLALLAGVRAAGSWKRYANAPRLDVVVLQALCAKGRASPPLALARLFPTSTKSPHLPREIFWRILSYWRTDRDP